MKLEAKEILLEAEKLTNNDRAEQYGSIQESFNLYSEILKTCFGLELKPTDIAKVMMAIKLGRQKFRHKMDNLVDLAGYTKILGVLQDGEQVKESEFVGDETTKKSESVEDETTKLYQDGISKILEFLNYYDKERARNKELPFIRIRIFYNKEKGSKFLFKIVKEIKQDDFEQVIIDLDEIDYVSLVGTNKNYNLCIQYYKNKEHLHQYFKLC